MSDGTRTGADGVVDTLVASGVEVMFGNPGTSEMHVVAALNHASGLRPILGLFEGVVTGAADGYARLSGKPAATLLHLGPGLGNGLANLHNARKAGSPVVNLVGDHASWHKAYETPLRSDVGAFADTVSHWVVETTSSSTAAADTARAVQAARAAPGQIATLVLPADSAWGPAGESAPALPVDGPVAADERAVAEAAAAIRDGNAVLLIRGAALYDEGLNAAARIAAGTDARIFSDTFAPRLRRGRGVPEVTRMPYRGADAVAALEGTRTLILVGALPPATFFAYPGETSDLTPAGARVVILAHPHEDGSEALRRLADALHVGRTESVNHSEQSVELTAAWGPRRVYQSVARFLPGDAIISDEAVTAGFGGYGVLADAAPHDILQLTGGAIGDGMPVATGAAVAAPGRRVVALEGDGSAMYTLQALWTQARERLNVTTVIFANRSYAVLDDELTRVGAHRGSGRAASLLDLHDPVIDWVHLAEGMGVEAVRTSDGHGFDAAFQSAMTARGPRLIEAVF